MTSSCHGCTPYIHPLHTEYGVDSSVRTECRSQSGSFSPTGYLYGVVSGSHQYGVLCKSSSGSDQVVFCTCRTTGPDGQYPRVTTKSGGLRPPRWRRMHGSRIFQDRPGSSTLSSIIKPPPCPRSAHDCQSAASVAASFALVALLVQTPRPRVTPQGDRDSHRLAIFPHTGMGEAWEKGPFR